MCKVIIVSNPTSIVVVLSCIEVVVGVLTIIQDAASPLFKSKFFPKLDTTLLPRL